MNAWLLGIVRLLMLVVISALALQAYFLMRIALMIIVDPQSTTFQRSEMWRMLAEQRRIVWSQQWVPYQRISPHLKRAVIASEDASFADHSGIDWDALEKAWERNLKAEAHAERANGQLERRTARSASVVAPRKVQARLVGGSTITQQLAKNLFLSGERALPRKAQEFVITLMLESVLPKQRILEIYLNNVEWGEGLFGAEAAARHYFHVGASQLGAYPSARLAVMLPAPKRFEKRPGSAYVAGRAATIVARMADVELP
jgi:monofunctional biosynthetic peptidoglycan transglycosylase